MTIFLIQLSLYISIIFSPEFLLLTALFAASISFIYLNIKRIPYRELLSVNCPNSIKGIIIIFISIALAAMMSEGLKQFFRTARPLDMLVQEAGYSFPSTHSTIAFAVCSTIVFLLFKYFRDSRHYINYLHVVLFSGIAILIAFSRVVLGVHRWADILAGAMLGLFVSYVSIKIYYNLIKYVDKKIYT